MHETENIFNIGQWEFLFIQIKHMGKIRDLFKKIRDTKVHFMQRWAQ